LADRLCQFFECDRPIKTVLDIGANVGESIERFRRIWPEAKIYSFEPRAVAFEKLFDAAAIASITGIGPPSLVEVTTK